MCGDDSYKSSFALRHDFQDGHTVMSQLTPWSSMERWVDQSDAKCPMHFTMQLLLQYALRNDTETEADHLNDCLEDQEHCQAPGIATRDGEVRILKTQLQHRGVDLCGHRAVLEDGCQCDSLGRGRA